MFYILQIHNEKKYIFVIQTLKLTKEIVHFLKFNFKLILIRIFLCRFFKNRYSLYFNLCVKIHNNTHTYSLMVFLKVYYDLIRCQMGALLYKYSTYIVISRLRLDEEKPISSPLVFVRSTFKI